jgi:predicted SAM-dependent methyltransferase
MLMLNLGCGDRFAPGWHNLDFVSVNPAVQRHNLLKELPFKDDSVDVIYHSHVLEHFSSSQSRIFLKHCYRKLKPGGIIRVVVPDLENICREYLKVFDGAIEGDLDYEKKYNWMIIELLDQMVRTKPGGEMSAFWKKTLESDDVAMIDYIYKRTGRNLCLMRDNGHFSFNFDRINLSTIKYILLFGYARLLRLLLPSVIGDGLLDQTLFGEKHRWMYDRFSLKNLLESVGFVDVKFVTANVSLIPNFTKYCMDCENDNTSYKSSSLYCEAMK